MKNDLLSKMDFEVKGEHVLIDFDFDYSCVGCSCMLGFE